MNNQENMSIFTKRCSFCGIEKSIDEFYKNGTKKLGVGSFCKKCSQEYIRQYRADNKEKIAECDKKYREDNKEELARRQRRYYDNNKEKVARRHKKYHQANRPLARLLNLKFVYGAESIQSYLAIRLFRLTNKGKISIKEANELFKNIENKEVQIKIMSYCLKGERNDNREI